MAARLRVAGGWGLLASGSLTLLVLTWGILGLVINHVATFPFHSVFGWIVLGLTSSVVAAGLLLALSRNVGRAIGAVALALVMVFIVLLVVIWNSDVPLGFGYPASAAFVTAGFAIPLVDAIVGVAALIVGWRLVRLGALGESGQT